MVSEKGQAVRDAADKAMEDEAYRQELAQDLSGSSRRARQQAASVLALVAKNDPNLVVPFIDDFIDALNRPEAQTRWEVLDVLTSLVAVESRSCDKALVGAETALFDEDNGMVRLAALRFICKLGATTENRSQKTWPLLDEAIQCYHGDFEYSDMLIALIGYSEGKLADEVKEGLKQRVDFDAKNSRGTMQRRSQQIIDNLA